MSQTVIRLPSAAPSYYTVRKAKGRWAVTLVTPCSGAPLRTNLYLFADREAAVDEA